tara:strand:- start:521 stop:961 length:441 start_codon:yes stop_codon:yes gene_type:complete
MNKTIPDPYIRKAVYNAFNGTIVDGTPILVYDTRYTTTKANNESYVVMSVQSNSVLYNKCSNFWESDILLEVCNLVMGVSNPGSRLLADNVLEALRLALQNNLDLDYATSGLTVDNQLMSFQNDLVTNLTNGTLYRKFLRLELRIK